MQGRFLQNLAFRFTKKLSSAELSQFAKELKFLLEAGIPLLKSLAILERSISSTRIKESIARLKEDISSGLSFSQSLRAQNSIFPEIFVNIVSAGEAGGILEKGLSRIAEYFETRDDLKKKIMSSLFYPCLVLLLSFASVLFITLYLVPTMNGIFSDLGIELPYLTRVISNFGYLILGYWHLMLLLGSGMIFVSGSLLKKKFGEGIFQKMILQFPVLGKVFRKMILSRISGTFSSLLGSGVPLLTSLSIISAVAGNVVYCHGISFVIESVEGGERLSSSLKKTGIFPESFCEAVSVGESSGRLEQVFGDLARYYEKEVESQLKVIVSLVEPASTLLVGVVVGVVVFSMFLPIVGMLDSLVK